MAKRKRSKTFFKIKEKLVLIPPKKFFGRKVIGVICLALGSLVLAFFSIYNYLIPRFLPNQLKDVKVEEKFPQFMPERIIILGTGVDLKVTEGLVEGGILPSANKFKKGEEVILLSGSNYRTYKITVIESRVSSASGTLSLGDYGLRLILPVIVKPAKITVLDAELSF